LSRRRLCSREPLIRGVSPCGGVVASCGRLGVCYANSRIFRYPGALRGHGAIGRLAPASGVAKYPPKAGIERRGFVPRLMLLLFLLLCVLMGGKENET
jgi:hypothetical protein